MPTIFSRIINGELPSYQVWADDVCVAFLSIDPLTEGHTLVVPRAEVDHWIDLDAQILAHVTAVAQRIGRGLMAEFRSARIGLLAAGLEVPHVHLHVVPFDRMEQLDFENARHGAPANELSAVAERVRAALRSRGEGDQVPT